MRQMLDAWIIETPPLCLVDIARIDELRSTSGSSPADRKHKVIFDMVEMLTECLEFRDYCWRKASTAAENSIC